MTGMMMRIIFGMNMRALISNDYEPTIAKTISDFLRDIGAASTVNSD
jgi:hypothetical protein